MKKNLSEVVRLLKVIGNGPRSARNYSEEEAFLLMRTLIERKMTPAQLGALFLSMRRKTTTDVELLSFIQSWESYYPSKKHLDLFIGSPFDGKSRTFYISPWALSVLSSVLSVQVSLGGSDLIGPKQGVREHQLLSFLPNKFKENLFLWDASLEYDFYNDCLKERNEIGLRSFLHTVEKCVSPYPCSYGVLTIHHRPYIERFIRIAQKRFRSSIIVIGEEGTTDLMWYRPTVVIYVRPCQIDHITLPALKEVTTLEEYVRKTEGRESFDYFKAACFDPVVHQSFMTVLVHQVALFVMLLQEKSWVCSIRCAEKLVKQYALLVKQSFNENQ